jgi:hypothetical protein
VAEADLAVGAVEDRVGRRREGEGDGVGGGTGARSEEEEVLEKKRRRRCGPVCFGPLFS